MKNQTQILARFAGRPLLLHPGFTAQLFEPFENSSKAGLLARLLGGTAKNTDPQNNQAIRPAAFVPRGCGEPIGEGLGYQIISSKHGGIACLDISGALFDRGFVSAWSNHVHWGYDLIAEAFTQMADDDRVSAAFLRINSPGGVVSGLLDEAVKAIAEFKAAGKVLHVFTSDILCSAALWLTAAADKITASRTALIGSVGVISLHWDDSKWLAKMGSKVTPIQFGAKKSDGAFFKPLSEQALADLQSQIDEVGEMFVSAIADGRGLDRQKVIDGQAAAWLAAGALSAGLIDEIALEGEAFKSLRGAAKASAPATGSKPVAKAKSGKIALSKNKETAMANRKALARVLGKKAVAALSALDLRKLEAAFAESDTPVKDEDELAAEEDEEDQIAAEEDDDDLTDAEKDEDDQTIAEKDDDDLMDAEEDEEDVNPKVAKAILDLNSAIGRRTLAQKLAFSPGMSVRQANSFLRAAPKATKASRLASKMNGQDPKVSASGGTSAASDEVVNRLIGAVKASGKGHRLVSSK